MEKVVRKFSSHEEADAADVEDDLRLRPAQRIKFCSTFKPGKIPMPLHKDLREFIESLNSARVEYLIVGAFAVSGISALATSILPVRISVSQTRSYNLA
jgi:hypothetical protein